MEVLSAFIQNIHPIPEEDLESLLACCEPVSFARKEIITWEGQTEAYLYFVLEGIQRSYYVKDGKEHVIAFVYPPSFSGIPESFFTQTPSKYFLECLTPCTMLRLPYDKFSALVEDSWPLERLMRKATVQFLAGMIQRHHELLAFTIEERFEAFVQRSAHLLTMIPHKHLASYLGISPTNFSKLLNKKKR